MSRHCYHNSFLAISFWLLVSCSNIEINSLPQPKSTPQLPLTQAESILPSPDGSWTAYFFGYDLETFRLSVANFDDSIIWNVSQPNFGSEASFTPYRWSHDSRYLYFNIHVAIDGYVPFYQGMGLQRLDVLNGEVLEILPDGDPITLENTTISDWNLVQFSLSPTDDKLAHISRMENGVQLVIRDIKANTESSIFFDQFIDAGSIVWSPKQDYLVLAAARGTNWSDALGFVELVEIDTLTTRTLVKSEDRFFDPLAWTNNHTILLKERGGPYSYLDTITEKLSLAPDLITFPN